LHIERGEGRVAQERADAEIALSSKHGLPGYMAWGMAWRGGALIVQRQWAEGVAQIRQGLGAYEGDVARTVDLTWLAVGYGGTGQVADGLATITEALRLVEKNDERLYEAEVYRIAGELLLRMRETESGRNGDKVLLADSPIRQFPVSSPEEAFLKAIEIAQKQRAKSLELRAAMSLSRLWQKQGKKEEARQMLADIYGWFTEGFETKDLQEAKALLEELLGE